MSLLLESIKVENKNAELLDYHLTRMRESNTHLFSSNFDSEKVRAHILELISNIGDNGLYKLRILYNQNKFSTELIPYSVRPINSIQCVYDNDISYDFKFADRTQLKTLFSQRGSSDDILIIKDGLVTDSYYANVAFFDGRSWITPATPLLQGTRRSQKISNSQVGVQIIHVDHIHSFEKISLFNAMLDLEELVLPTASIQL